VVGRWSISVLEEDIEWGDVVFGAGSNAAAGTSFSLTRIFFGRQLDTSRSHDFGIGAGLHWLEMGAFIEGEILINGTPTASRRSVSEGAPLPNIGAWYMYSISPRWALRTRLDLLSADVGDYDGLLVNSGWRGKFETTYDGVYVYASLYY